MNLHANHQTWKTHKDLCTDATDETNLSLVAGVTVSTLTKDANHQKMLGRLRWRTLVWRGGQEQRLLNLPRAVFLFIKCAWPNGDLCWKNSRNKRGGGNIIYYYISTIYWQQVYCFKFWDENVNTENVALLFQQNSRFLRIEKKQRKENRRRISKQNCI